MSPGDPCVFLFDGHTMLGRVMHIHSSYCAVEGEDGQVYAVHVDQVDVLDDGPRKVLLPPSNGLED